MSLSSFSLEVIVICIGRQGPECPDGELEAPPEAIPSQWAQNG